jgi:3-oxoacyl-[acyl-carrier protein] reductase
MKINEKYALLTGVSGGIGKFLLQSLLDSGVYVIGTSKQGKKLEGIKSEFKNYENKLYLIPADLSQISEVKELCSVIKSKIGHIDIIINNAGIFHFKKLKEITDKMVFDSFMVNVQAPMLICRSFTSSMIENKWGRIINICSSSAYNGGGTPRHCVYSSTKHALLGFSRALDEELRQYNIRVGSVSPAGVNTDMVKNRDDLDSNTFMSPQFVADAVMFLLLSDGPGIIYELYIHRLNR